MSGELQKMTDGLYVFRFDLFELLSKLKISTWKQFPRGSKICVPETDFWSEKWLMMHTNTNNGNSFLANENQYFLLKIAPFRIFWSPQLILVSSVDSMRIWFERNVLKNDCGNIFSKFRIVFIFSFHSICSYYIQYSHFFFGIRYEIDTCISNDLPHVDSTANFYCPWQVKAFLLLDIYFHFNSSTPTFGSGAWPQIKIFGSFLLGASSFVYSGGGTSFLSFWNLLFGCFAFVFCCARSLCLEASADPKSRCFGLSFWECLLWSGHGGSLNGAWIFAAQDHLYALQEHASQVKILVSSSLTTEVRPFNCFLCWPAQSKCFKSLAHSLVWNL